MSKSNTMTGTGPVAAQVEEEKNEVEAGGRQDDGGHLYNVNKDNSRIGSSEFEATREQGAARSHLEAPSLLPQRR